MNKKHWGRKRVCMKCGTKFYDLEKEVVKCPSCGEDYDPEFYLKKRSKIEMQEEIIEIDEEMESPVLSDDEDDDGIVGIIDDGDEIIDDGVKPKKVETDHIEEE